MFIDEKTQVQIHADLDKSVIHGTMRNCDIIPALIGVIKDTPEYTQLIASAGHPIHSACSRIDMKTDNWWCTDDADYLCADLFDICDLYAPEGYCFSSHPGDGSDFGYWKHNY